MVVIKDKKKCELLSFLSNIAKTYSLEFDITEHKEGCFKIEMYSGKYLFNFNTVYKSNDFEKFKTLITQKAEEISEAVMCEDCSECVETLADLYGFVYSVNHKGKNCFPSSFVLKSNYGDDSYEIFIKYSKTNTTFEIIEPDREGDNVTVIISGNNIDRVQNILRMFSLACVVEF